MDGGGGLVNMKNVSWSNPIQKLKIEDFVVFFFIFSFWGIEWGRKEEGGGLSEEIENVSWGNPIGKVKIEDFIAIFWFLRFGLSWGIGWGKSKTLGVSKPTYQKRPKSGLYESSPKD